MPGPKFDIEVQLTGVGGNIFVLMGTVTRALRRGGVDQQSINDFVNEITDCDSYDSALVVIMKTVHIS
jgi:hypothetical protein